MGVQVQLRLVKRVMDYSNCMSIDQILNYTRVGKRNKSNTTSRKRASLNERKTTIVVDKFCMYFYYTARQK